MGIQIFDFSSLPPQQESDIDHPFLWFESIIKVDAPHRFKNDFYKVAESYQAEKGGRTNYTEDSFTYFSELGIEGVLEEICVTYKDFFNSIVKYQVDKSKTLIFSKVGLCQTQEQAEFVIKNIINQIDFLLRMLKKHRHLSIRAFPSVPLGLYDILIYLREAHSIYLPSEIPVIFKEALNPPLVQFSNLLDPPDQNISEAKLPSAGVGKAEVANPDKSQENKPLINEKNKILERGLNSFSWRHNGELFSHHLFKILKDHKVIFEEETELVKFSKAFNGERLESPLEIRWHLMSSHKSVKAPILRMIDHLMENLGLLNNVSSNAKLVHMIENIFVDQNGKKLQSIQASRAGMGKKWSFKERKLFEDLDRLRERVTQDLIQRNSDKI